MPHLDNTTNAEVVKITEMENTGIHSTSISHTAIGYILSGEKYIYNNDRCTVIKAGSIFILGAGHHYEENSTASSWSSSATAWRCIPRRRTFMR